MRAWSISRLMWRFYAVGLAQLFLALVAAGVIGVTMHHWARRADMETLRAQVEPVVLSPARLKTELDAWRRREGVLLTLYDAQGRVLASNHSAPLRTVPRYQASDEPLEIPGPPPSGLGPPRLLPPGGPPVAFSRVALGGGQQGLLEARFLPTPPSPLPVALALIAGALVVGLGAVLSARFVGKPLERLSRAVRAFGAGDLRVRAEAPTRDELGEVLSTFNDMADRIQHLVAAEKELLANVAHELRTPLARIRVAMEIAAEGDASTAKGLITGIATDLTELQTLIDDVLSAARFEAAAGHASPATFALQIDEIAPTTIVEEAVERFRARHPERELVVSLAPELPLIDADVKLMRRVIDNLLENAHKYSPEPAARIELRASSSDGMLLFEVEDRGMGIPEADLPRAFSAFFRGERSRSRRSGGVGLGLTLAKRIVEAHRGTIDIHSQVDVGTQVRIALPVVQALEAPRRMIFRMAKVDS